MDDLKPVTHLLVIDVASKKGIKLLEEGLHYLVIAFDKNLICCLHDEYLLFLSDKLFKLEFIVSNFINLKCFLY